MAITCLIIAVFGLFLPAAAMVATADCSCGSTDQNNACTGTTTGNYSVSGKSFRFDFECNGGACACGQFINGEYWVAPIDAQGNATGTVVLKSVSAAGNGGLELNTPGGSNNRKQSLLPSEAHYDSNLNLRGSLPLTIDPSTGPQSLITADVGSSGCASGNFDNCVRRATVLTVVSSVPEQAGSETFRPPWAGTQKPMYTWSQVRTDILPAHRIIGDYYPEGGADLNSIEANFAGALYDKCAGLSAITRMCLSQFATDGSDFAEKTHGAILTLIGPGSVAAKKPALINFLQHGIDRYGLWKIGNFHPPGAGQNVGRYAPLAFAATLIDEPTLKADVRDIGRRGEVEPDEYLPWYRGHDEFDLFGHIRISERSSAPGGVIATHTPGHYGVTAQCGSDNLYWSIYQNKTGSKDCGDYYGYLDMGPRGIPQSYMGCCWTEPAKGLVTAMWGFPQLRLVINYEPFITYIDRVAGTLPNSSHQGTWAYGPCSAQKPAAGATDCIKTSSVNSPDARHPTSHGKPMSTGGNVVEPAPHVYPVFRRCFEQPGTAGCGDYVAPYCGDGVCDSRGTYSQETVSSCSADCDLTAGATSTTPPFVLP